VADYIKERVDLHKRADGLLNEPERVDYCTPDERWARPDTWAVAKKETDRARRVLATEAEALEYIKSNHLDGFMAWYRQGADARCESYCSYAQWCSYAKRSR